MSDVPTKDEVASATPSRFNRPNKKKGNFLRNSLIGLSVAGIMAVSYLTFKKDIDPVIAKAGYAVASSFSDDEDTAPPWHVSTSDSLLIEQNAGSIEALTNRVEALEDELVDAQCEMTFQDYQLRHDIAENIRKVGDGLQKAPEVLAEYHKLKQQMDVSVKSTKVALGNAVVALNKRGEEQLETALQSLRTSATISGTRTEPKLVPPKQPVVSLPKPNTTPTVPKVVSTPPKPDAVPAPATTEPVKLAYQLSLEATIVDVDELTAVLTRHSKQLDKADVKNKLQGAPRVYAALGPSHIYPEYLDGDVKRYNSGNRSALLTSFTEVSKSPIPVGNAKAPVLEFDNQGNVAKVYETGKPATPYTTSAPKKQWLTLIIEDEKLAKDMEQLVQVDGSYKGPDIKVNGKTVKDPVGLLLAEYVRINKSRDSYKKTGVCIFKPNVAGANSVEEALSKALEIVDPTLINQFGDDGVIDAQEVRAYIRDRLK